MLANRVKEYTTTTGTGDIALSGAVAGHIRLCEAFPLGSGVNYVIEDDDNYEIGIGTLDSSGRLQRSSVQETLVGGALSIGGAKAIKLSGRATVYLSTTSEFLANKPLEVEVD